MEIIELYTENGLTLERVALNDGGRYFRIRKRLKTLGRFADITNAIQQFEQWARE